jgi:hypothetical protein
MLFVSFFLSIAIADFFKHLPSLLPISLLQQRGKPKHQCCTAFKKQALVIVIYRRF